MTAVIGVDGLAALHALARQAVAAVPGLLSAEFFTSAGLDVLVAHAGLVPPLPAPPPRTCCWTRPGRARSTTWRR